MAIDGANANLGPESKEWERKLETLVLTMKTKIENLERQIGAR